MPALRIGTLLGTQYQYAALNEVPPSVAAFSRISTLLPSQRENSAAGKPPPPPPATTMSYSASKVAACASFALSVTAPKVAAAVPAPAALRNSRRDVREDCLGDCVLDMSPPGQHCSEVR